MMDDANMTDELTSSGRIAPAQSRPLARWSVVLEGDRPRLVMTWSVPTAPALPVAAVPATATANRSVVCSAA